MNSIINIFTTQQFLCHFLSAKFIIFTTNSEKPQIRNKQSFNVYCLIFKFSVCGAIDKQVIWKFKVYLCKGEMSSIYLIIIWQFKSTSVNSF